jgi:hypothetical protein
LGLLRLAFDFVLDELVQLHLVFIELSADAQMLRS